MTATNNTHHGDTALLPTGTRMNTAEPEKAEFYDSGQVAYLVKVGHTKGLRVLTSHGSLKWKVGDKARMIHDQTHGFLGEAEVVAIKFFDSGHTEGDWPEAARKVPHYVFK